jgi:3-phytase
MKKQAIYTVVSIVLLSACTDQQNSEAPSSNSNSTKVVQVDSFGFEEVMAVLETDPVSADPEDDAADDPAIWVHPLEPMKSLVFGSDKKKGLDVFNMSGERINTYEVGRINNVDVRQDVFQGIDIVAGSNRTTNATDVWRIEASDGTLVHLGSIASDLPDVYGFCLYHHVQSGEVFAFINSKTGRVEQWRLNLTNDSVRGEKVRELNLGKQVEGMVADDMKQQLYVGVEVAGVYLFDANADADVNAKFLPMTSEENQMIAYDVEGLAIFSNDDVDYLIVSSQGNDSYAVFDRMRDHRYVGSFKVVDGAVDGSQETDGIEACSSGFGSVFPDGLFICQDGFNYEGETKVAQNFKLVSWRDIALAMKL